MLIDVEQVAGPRGRAILGSMKFDPDFSIWLREAVVGMTYTIEANPARLRDLQTQALAEARGLLVTLKTEVQPFSLLCTVEARDEEAAKPPLQRAKELAARPQPFQEGEKLVLTVRKGDASDLQHALQSVFWRKGFNVVDTDEDGVFTLRRRLAGLKAFTLPAPRLQSPEELEAAGVLRFDSADLEKKRGAGPWGSGRFAAGGPDPLS